MADFALVDTNKIELSALSLPQQEFKHQSIQSTIDFKPHLFDPSPQSPQKSSIPTQNRQPSAILNEWYYMFYNDRITGPHNHDAILKKYISKEIIDKIWVKRAADPTAQWCIIYLEISDCLFNESNISNIGNEDDTRTKVLSEAYPNLYRYLIPKIQRGDIRQLDAPVDIPEDAVKELSCVIICVRLIGTIVVLVIGCIATVHCWLPLFWLVSKLFFCCYPTRDADRQRRRATFISLNCFLALFYIFVPYIYLGQPEGNEWTSWKIAYMVWGVCSWFLTMVVIIAVNGMYHDKLSQILSVLFWITGVEFEVPDESQFLMNGMGWKFIGIYTANYPPLAAALPAAIAGYIANFMMEEKFEVVCSEDVTNDTLCFGDHHGCCEVLSSWDLENVSFLGELASNILAAWGIIRIIGYIMINNYFLPKKVSVFAKRKE